MDPPAYLAIACIDLVADVTVKMPIELTTDNSEYDVQIYRIMRGTGLGIAVPKSLRLVLLFLGTALRALFTAEMFRVPVEVNLKSLMFPGELRRCHNALLCRPSKMIAL